MSEIDFQKYKNKTPEYLNAKGIPTHAGENISCILPTHNGPDKNPSMAIYEDGYKCFSCGERGDIYDLAGLINGITDKTEQYKEVERTLNGYTLPAKKNRKPKQFNLDAYKAVKEYCKLQAKTHKSELEKFSEYRGYGSRYASGFRYWPGYEKAASDLGIKTLHEAGIPKHDRAGKPLFENSGPVLRLEKGFKLFHIDDSGKTVKINSSGASPFPFPPEPKGGDYAVVVESELSALAGICNNIPMIACGGVYGMGSRGADVLKGYDEIIICFDADDAGSKASEKAALKLFENGYIGKIKIACIKSFEGGNDPDDYIRSGKIEELKNAISNAEIWEPETTEEHENNISPDEIIYNPSHALYARALINGGYLKGWITDEISFNRYEFLYKPEGKPHYEKIHNLRNTLSVIAEKMIDDAEKEIKTNNKIDDPKTFYEHKGKDIQKVRTADFQNGIISHLGGMLYKGPYTWDSEPEVFACNDGVIDFKGSAPIFRPANENEFFKIYADISANEIIKAKEEKTPLYDLFLKQLFTDKESRKTIRYCLSLLISNKGHKYFIIWYESGDNGKTVLMNLIRHAIGEKIKTALPVDILLSNGDTSKKRFALIELAGRSGAFCDESPDNAKLSLSICKALSAGSGLFSGERKGRDAITFAITWSMILLTNFLPNFYPADDTAFVDRLITIPFRSAFVRDNTHREKKIQQGYDPNRIFDRVADSDKLISEIIEKERAGILYSLINDYIHLRDRLNMVIPISSEVAEAKQKYIKNNDVIEQFYLENFTANTTGFVSNRIIKELYQNGDYGKLTVRSLCDRLIRKYNFVERSIFQNQRGLKGISLITEAETPIKEEKELEFAIF